jgi:hypothetical protein
MEGGRGTGSGFGFGSDAIAGVSAGGAWKGGVVGGGRGGRGGWEGAIISVVYDCNLV